MKHLALSLVIAAALAVPTPREHAPQPLDFDELCEAVAASRRASDGRAVGAAVRILGDKLLTCAHVGRIFQGARVSEAMELAIVPTEKGYSIKLADAEPAVGRRVYVIGHPRGLSYSVTSGIVSALHRGITLNNGAELKDVMQIDAPVNPGNSGGPVLNDRGELVGITVAVDTESNGIGWAVSLTTIKKFLEQK